MVPVLYEKGDPWCCGMGWVSAKILPSTLGLVRLVTLKGDYSPVFDTKWVLETPRKHKASSVQLYPSSPSSLSTHRSRGELRQ